MTVRVKQDRTRKGGYNGSRNTQDGPKEAQTLPPPALARHSINQATISAEIAARCLDGKNAAAWEHLRIALGELKQAMEDLKR